MHTASWSGDWVVRIWTCTLGFDKNDCGYKVTLSQASPVTMPDAPDVRWNFWVAPFATTLTSESLPFTAQVGPLTFKLWGVGPCPGIACSQYDWVFLDNGVPTPWGAVRAVAGGYYITSYNLNTWLAAGSAYGVEYTASGYWNDIVPNTFSAMEPLVSDRPTPEPSNLLLFGSGILGLAGFVRRKALM